MEVQQEEKGDDAERESGKGYKEPDYSADSHNRKTWPS